MEIVSLVESARSMYNLLFEDDGDDEDSDEKYVVELLRPAFFGSIINHPVTIPQSVEPGFFSKSFYTWTSMTIPRSQTMVWSLTFRDENVFKKMKKIRSVRPWYDR